MEAASKEGSENDIYEDSSGINGDSRGDDSDSGADVNDGEGFAVNMYLLVVEVMIV